MKMTFRWFGEESDSVSLQDIRQIPNTTGIMGVLDQYAAGEVWPLEAIEEYVQNIRNHGLEIEIIESVNVHEDIKLGLPSRDEYIENYKKTLKNLAKSGIKIVIYNFMPVFDWLRTELHHVDERDGSKSMYYNQMDIEGMTPRDIVAKTTSNSEGFSLPGWEPERLMELEKVISLYSKMTEEKLLDNYKYFLEKIIPVCEEVGIKMAVHPDDPAWSVFGIPRIAHSKEQFDAILNLVPSPSNSLCFCTGSYGSNPNNDVVEAIYHFGKQDKIACAHIRNIKFLGDKEFKESSHFSNDGSIDMFKVVKAFHDIEFKGSIRPDHGRMIWGEQGRPGYGLYDRALGITYLNGLWEALEKINQ